LKTDEQCWADSGPRPHGASLAQGWKWLGQPMASARREHAPAVVTTLEARVVARSLAARDATRWGMVAGRAVGVAGECAGQDKRRRGSARSPGTGGAEEKLRGGDVPSGDGTSVSLRTMLGSLQHQDDEGGEGWSDWRRGAAREEIIGGVDSR
jgi:hypothetical protein